MNYTNYNNQNMIEPVPGIYLGDRGEAFKTLITNVLKRGITKKKYLDILTDDESMDVYSAAFTSELVDADHNYQVYEQLGDLTGNKFIVWYIYRRFPQLKCSEGVKVAARLRINYGAKNSFYAIAEKLGFWNFISATNDLRQRKMKPLLEDVFEAFIGATESILDDRVKEGIGYAFLYKILKNIFDEMEISLRYEDLYDAKTRLKELFDLHGEQLGPLVYQEKREDVITYSNVFRVQGGSYEVRPNGTINTKRIVGGRYVKIGEGSAALKADAQQKAAVEALRNLNGQGWIKHPPAIYRRFASGEVNQKKDVKAEDLDATTINEMCTTRDKTKYQSKYQSTKLASFCRTRNLSGVKACLELKADPNIPDTDGMKPLDLLFIGKVAPSIVKKIMKRLVKAGCDMEIQEQVYEAYYTKYTSQLPYFETQVEDLSLVGEE